MRRCCRFIIMLFVIFCGIVIPVRVFAYESMLVRSERPLSGVVKAVSAEGVEREWSELRNSLDESLYSKEKISITGIFEGNSFESPEEIFYYKVDCKDSRDENAILSEAELENILNWKEFRRIELNKSQSVVIYFKIVDSSGRSTYINTGHLLVDTQEPIIEKLTFMAAKDSKNYVNGIFKDDVIAAVAVTDPAVGNIFSGIQSISYKVFNMGSLTQEEILSKSYSHEVMMQDWNGTFVVDSVLNNSNNVVVRLIVRDYVGNVSTKEMQLKIDISEPSIRVFYDNNKANRRYYFSEDRTAAIEVQERNFRPEDVRITVTNKNEIVPMELEWTLKEGAGNGDNTSWIAKIPYREEGDYTFSISYCDLAGNVCSEVDYGLSVSPIKFVIDKTAPIVSVRYNAHNKKSNNYYAESRTATIEIQEKNLDINEIILDFDISENGEKNSLPEIQGWTRNGIMYKAEVFFADDGKYIFDIIVTDKAGNCSKDYVKDVFWIDTVAPSVVIEGVENDSSYNGEICPRIICTDENYSTDQIEIELRKSYGDVYDLEAEKKIVDNVVYYIYENIPTEIERDSAYELNVKMTDKAGNCTVQSIKFTVNRYGSSYVLDETIRKIINSYTKEVEDLVVQEMNVDPLEKMEIILFKNGKSLLLENEKNYKIEMELKENGKYQYTYTIFKENFAESGIYQLVIQSKDRAGNVSDNNSKDKDAEIKFGVDKVKPNLLLLNLEAGNIYERDVLTVYLDADDNFRLNQIEVYVDDYNDVYKKWNSEELKTLELKGETLTFDIFGNSILPHRVRIKCIDEAGNESVKEISGFYVTTSPWSFFWKNKELFAFLLVGATAMIFVVCRIVYKKRRIPLSDLKK